MKQWSLLISFAFACGGSNSNSSGASNTGITISGDAASGVSDTNIPCGYPKSITGGLTIGPAVEYETFGASEVILLGQFPAVNKAALVEVVSAGATLPLTQVTQQTSGMNITFGYSEPPASWVASSNSSGANGSFTLELSSATTTDLTACDSSYLGVSTGTIVHATTCQLVHGTAHAVLVPPVISGVTNPAKGTVTMDVSF
jgi:hypothetical protein